MAQQSKILSYLLHMQYPELNDNLFLSPTPSILLYSQGKIRYRKQFVFESVFY